MHKRFVNLECTHSGTFIQCCDQMMLLSRGVREERREAPLGCTKCTVRWASRVRMLWGALDILRRGSHIPTVTIATIITQVKLHHIIPVRESADKIIISSQHGTELYFP